MALSTSLFTFGCTDDGLETSSSDDEVGEDCQPPITKPGGYEVSAPIDSPPFDWRDWCAEEEFVGLANADPLGTIPLEFEILHPTVGGEWPEEKFPILVFSNGNTQYWNNYDDLHGAIVSAEFIVANLKSGPGYYARLDSFEMAQCPAISMNTGIGA